MPGIYYSRILQAQVGPQGPGQDQIPGLRTQKILYIALAVGDKRKDKKRMDSQARKKLRISGPAGDEKHPFCHLRWFIWSSGGGHEVSQGAENQSPSILMMVLTTPEEIKERLSASSVDPRASLPWISVEPEDTG